MVLGAGRRTGRPPAVLHFGPHLLLCPLLGKREEQRSDAFFESRLKVSLSLSLYIFI